MSRITAIAATALLILGLADEGASVLAEEQSILGLRQSFETPSGDTADFAEVSDGDSVAETPADDAFWYSSADGQSEMSPVDERCSATIDCWDGDRLIDDDRCGVDGHRGWTYEIGMSALQSQMATSDLADWPNDFGPAGRITIGYEWEDGLGIRTQAWGYSVKGNVSSQLPSSYYLYDPYYYSYYVVPGATNRLLYAQAYTYTRPIEISAATAYLDFYRSIHTSHGEFALGMGPAFGHLEYRFQSTGGGTRYYGGGISAFGQGYVPIIERNRWELALTGQTRAALLTGNWDVDVLNTDAEHNKSMSILELNAGPELRYRIGATDDRYLFLRTVAEFQQWRSDRMGPIAGDTLGLQGASMNFGMLW
jgi:hypothetical protein